MMLSALMSTSALAEPKVVAGPATDPDCYAPWASDTTFFQYEAKPGPYRIAVANGYVANTWRIQMIKTAKAYSEQPDVAKDIKELKVFKVFKDLREKLVQADRKVFKVFQVRMVKTQT